MFKNVLYELHYHVCFVGLILHAVLRTMLPTVCDKTSHDNLNNILNEILHTVHTWNTTNTNVKSAYSYYTSYGILQILGTLQSTGGNKHKVRMSLRQTCLQIGTELVPPGARDQMRSM